MDNAITKNCELNVEDAVAWSNYYLENSPQWKRNWKLIRFVFMPVMVLCFAVSVGYLVISANKGLTISSMIAGGIGIIVGLGGFLYYSYYPAILRRRIRKAAQKVYSRQNNFIGNHKYIVSAEGIRDNDENIVKWTAVEGIAQTDKHVFILVNPKKALIIPKRAFADDAAVNRFTADIRAIFQASRKAA